MSPAGIEAAGWPEKFKKYVMHQPLSGGAGGGAESGRRADRLVAEDAFDFGDGEAAAGGAGEAAAGGWGRSVTHSGRCSGEGVCAVGDVDGFVVGDPGG